MSSAKLGEVADFINGAAFKPEDWGGEGWPIIRIQNLTDPTKPFNRTRRSVSPKLHVEQGDLLVSWSATLGVFVWDHEETGLLNQHIFRVLPNVEIVDKSYLKHMLNDALLAMSSHLHGATMQHVNRGAFLATEIPLPSLPEQRRIASILDQASELIELQRRAILLTAELIKSAFIEAFGEPLESSKKPAAVSLDSICNAIVDCPHTTPIWVDEGVVCLRTTNLSRGEWSFDETRFVSEATHEARVRRAELEPGDIILSREGTIGVAAIVPVGMRASLGQRLVQVRADQGVVHPEFLLSYLLEVLEPARLTQLLVGSTSQHVNVRDLRNLKVMVPELSIQQNYAETVDKIRLLLTQQRTHLIKLDELFASLQHRAFRGEL